VTGDTYVLRDTNKTPVQIWVGIIDVDAVSNANVVILYGKSAADDNKPLRVEAVVNLPQGYYIERKLD
jgi:hypothetical protein